MIIYLDNDSDNSIDHYHKLLNKINNYHHQMIFNINKLLIVIRVDITMLQCYKLCNYNNLSICHKLGKDFKRYFKICNSNLTLFTIEYIHMVI